MLVELLAAARSAGISKPYIYRLKDSVPQPPYFHQVQVNGKMKWRVDVSHPQWIEQSQEWKRKAEVQEKLNRPLNNLVQATVETIKEILDPEPEVLNKILIRINEKWQNAS